MNSNLKLPEGFELIQFPMTIELYYHDQFVDGWPVPYSIIADNEWQSLIDRTIKIFETERNNA